MTIKRTVIINFSMHNIVRAAIKAQVCVNREEHQDSVMKVWTNLTIEVQKKDETKPKWRDRVYSIPYRYQKYEFGNVQGPDFPRYFTDRAVLYKRKY